MNSQNIASSGSVRTFTVNWSSAPGGLASATILTSICSLAGTNGLHITLKIKSRTASAFTLVIKQYGSTGYTVTIDICYMIIFGST